MIKITKRDTPPQPIRTVKDYQDGPNFTALAEDCYSKCYICELQSSTLNVEHLVSHRGNADRKFDWHNLFLSCGHCNNIKRANYDGILDPSKCDPEDFVAVSLAFDGFMEKVTVEVLREDESVRQTAALLRSVYNGEMTAMKKVESANLRNKVSACIRKFSQYIESYRDESDKGLCASIEKKIEEEISRSSEFAAFKRKIVRDDAELSATFASALM